MLHADSYRERLLRHHDSFFVKHFECVSGAVADGKNDGVCGYAVLRKLSCFRMRAINIQCLKPAIAFNDAINSGFESYLAAQLDYLFSYIDYHRAEDVGAYVRLCQIHYVIAGPGISELGQDLSDQPVLYACRELAVRESACSALAKEHVGLRV